MQIIDEYKNIIRERRATCSKDLVGLAGEHLTCALLCRIGLSTVLYPHGTKKVDLSATNVENLKEMEFQVKTLRSGHQFFLNSKKFKSKDNFYIVLIEFFDDPNENPNFYIIPSKIVSSEGKWNAKVPYININRTHEVYKNNWSPIIDYLFS